MRLVNPSTGEAMSLSTVLSGGWKRVNRRLSRPRTSMKLALGDHPSCAHDENCAPFAARLHEKLAGGPYDWPASILRVDDQTAYLADHRTARKRAAHSRRLGYVSRPIDLSEHLDEVYAINTSLPERQGRQMTSAYRQRPTRDRLPSYRCPRHRADEWGVMSPEGVLVAYLVLYLCGEVAMLNSILGHGDHLRDDVMYLLVLEALAHVPLPATVYYDRHDAGTDGLRYFKERLGFQPARVEWVL